VGPQVVSVVRSILRGVYSIRDTVMVDVVASTRTPKQWRLGWPDGPALQWADPASSVAARESRPACVSALRSLSAQKKGDHDER
jgi:hypothetical protein